VSSVRAVANTLRLDKVVDDEQNLKTTTEQPPRHGAKTVTERLTRTLWLGDHVVYLLSES
jgi:hypothetical protein